MDSEENKGANAYSHDTNLPKPPCQSTVRRIARSDIVEPRVPRKPTPPDWITASTNTSCLYKPSVFDLPAIRRAFAPLSDLPEALDGMHTLVVHTRPAKRIDV